MGEFRRGERTVLGCGRAFGAMGIIFSVSLFQDRSWW